MYCPYCGERVSRVGADAIDVCDGCGVVVEGEAVSEPPYEALGDGNNLDEVEE